MQGTERDWAHKDTQDTEGETGHRSRYRTQKET